MSERKAKRKEVKRKRPRYLVRLSSTLLDIGLCMLVLAQFQFLTGSLPWWMLGPAILFYYAGCEAWWGRTPGKYLWGIRLATVTGGAPSRSRFILRWALRLLGPVMMLSWRRVTLLDALCGMRARRSEASIRSDREEILQRSLR